jgi:uncharacterized protein with PIN domain
MGLFDRLFERKRNKDVLEEFQRMQERRDGVINSGNYSERDGLTVCPHCGYKLSQQDIEENRRRCSGLPEGLNPKDFFECPACRRVLNY